MDRTFQAAVGDGHGFGSGRQHLFLSAGKFFRPSTMELLHEARPAISYGLSSSTSEYFWANHPHALAAQAAGESSPLRVWPFENGSFLRAAGSNLQRPPPEQSHAFGPGACKISKAKSAATKLAPTDGPASTPRRPLPCRPGILSCLLAQGRGKEGKKRYRGDRLRRG